PMFIVIDGLDEYHNPDEQIKLLRDILNSAHRLCPSFRILICCRPERYLEKVFNEFDLGHIRLGQSSADNDDIRTFLRVSFNSIRHDHHTDNAMSNIDRQWPSDYEVEHLVVRASGQFIFAVAVVEFV
ncbi:hypothetical protein BDN72DRAFT_739219, partial [Pluteus cervinus]